LSLAINILTGELMFRKKLLGSYTCKYHYKPRKLKREIEELEKAIETLKICEKYKVEITEN
jgi:phage host-nuclease inhibitor protein Gam